MIHLISAFRLQIKVIDFHFKTITELCFGITMFHIPLLHWVLDFFILIEQANV